jgi:cytochrome c1
MLSQFVTPAPVRGSSLVPWGLQRDISWGTVCISACYLLTPNAVLIEYEKPEGRIDQTDMDFDKVDAQIVLEVARTRCTICRLEQELVEARYAESIGLVKLYKHWAEDARKQHDYAEFDLGLARDVVTNNFNPSELLIMRRPNTKRLHLSSPSEYQRTSKYLISMLVYTSSHQWF